MDGMGAVPVTEPVAGRHSWAYSALADLHLSSPLEDHLFAAVHKLTSRLDVAGVCDAVLTGVEAVFGATSSWIMLFDGARNSLCTESYRGVAAEIYQGLEIPLATGSVLASVFAHREIVFVADVRREEGWYNRKRVYSSGLHSILALPLIVNDTAIGVIGLVCPLQRRRAARYARDQTAGRVCRPDGGRVDKRAPLRAKRTGSRTVADAAA